MLFVLGINYQQTPIEIREKLALSELLEAFYGWALESDVIQETFVLSTCNRCEVYIMPTPVGEANLEALEEKLLCFWADLCGLTQAELKKTSFFSLWGALCLEHLVRVAVGLEAMMLGEPQILGQVKQAFSWAKTQGNAGIGLEKLMSPVFELVKKVRNETSIGCSPVSFASATYKLASQIFSQMNDAQILLVGAGEMIELVCRHFYHHQSQNLTVVNRTLKRIDPLVSNYNVSAYGLEHLPSLLAQSDVVVSCTASPSPLILAEDVDTALSRRRRKPMFFADLAVPRDIESAIHEFDDAFLYTVDDIFQVVNLGQDHRTKAAELASNIIREGIESLLASRRVQAFASTIQSYRSQVEALRTDALANARRGLMKGEDPHKVLEQLSKVLTNKIIHQPTLGLRDIAQRGKADELLLAKNLLGLSDQVLSSESKQSI